MNKKITNVLWGIAFIIGALIIVFSKLGMISSVGLFSVIISILLLPTLITSVARLNYWGIVFSLAIYAIIYSDPLGISALSPWTILVVALFLSIGLSFIFPHHHQNSEFEERITGERIIDEPDGEIINIDAKFSGSIKYVNTTNLKKINLDCAFGAIKLYFDHADMAGSEAVLDVDMMCSGGELYLPRNWRIKDNVNNFISGVEIKGIPMDNADKTLIINGDLHLSGIKIIYYI